MASLVSSQNGSVAEENGKFISPTSAKIVRKLSFRLRKPHTSRSSNNSENFFTDPSPQPEQETSKTATHNERWGMRKFAKSSRKSKGDDAAPEPTEPQEDDHSEEIDMYSNEQLELIDALMKGANERLSHAPTREQVKKALEDTHWHGGKAINLLNARHEHLSTRKHKEAAQSAGESLSLDMQSFVDHKVFQFITACQLEASVLDAPEFRDMLKALERSVQNDEELGGARPTDAGPLLHYVPLTSLKFTKIEKAHLKTLKANSAYEPELNGGFVAQAMQHGSFLVPLLQPSNGATKNHEHHAHFNVTNANRGEYLDI